MNKEQVISILRKNSFSRLQRTLPEMLGCGVDLATPEALHKSMRGRITEEAVRAA